MFDLSKLRLKIVNDHNIIYAVDWSGKRYWIGMLDAGPGIGVKNE